MTHSLRTAYASGQYQAFAALIFLVLVGWPEAGNGQELPDFGVEWRWVDFGPESGLPSGVPRALVEMDSVIWTHTESGSAWYDGFQWHPAVSGDSLLTGRVTSLAPDSAGRLLLVQGGRLYRGNTEGFTPVPVPAGLADQFIQKVLPFEGDRLLVTVRAQTPQLWILDGNGALEASDVVLADAGGLWVTDAGNAWVSTPGGFTMWRNGRWVNRDPLVPAPRPPGLLVVEGEGGAGVVWRMDNEGRRAVFRFEGDGPLVPQPSEGDNAMVTASAGPQGLMITVFESGDVRAWTGEEWASVDLPTSRREGMGLVHIGRDGNFWFGSTRGLHLFRSRLNRFAVIRRAFPSPTNRVNAVMAARDGNVWLGTGGGVLGHRPGVPTWFEEAAGITLDAVTGLAEDTAGGVWATSGSGFQGAVRFREGVWERMGPDQGLDVGFVHRVFTEADGTVWFASLGRGDGTGAGLYRWTEGDGVEAMFPALGIEETRTYAVARAPGGPLWVATGVGAYRLDPGGGYVFFPVGSLGDPPWSSLWDVAVDTDGSPWFAANPYLGAGLLHLEGDTLVPVVPPNGESARRVWSAVFGADGTLWMGTEAGILNYRDDVWTLFDGSMGLPTANIWPVVLHPTNVLAGSKGGGLIILSRAEAESPAPRVLLRGQTLDGRSLRLAFTPLPYWGERPVDRLETRTRIDGGAWGGWSLDREVLIPNLSPGAHAVEVQAKGLFGQLSEPTLSEVVVPFPLPLRPAFAVPVGLLLAALVGVGSMAARRRAVDREALRLSEGRMRALVEGSYEAIGILDLTRGRFVDANANALTLAGVDRPTFLSRDLMAISPPVLPDGSDARQRLGSLAAQAAGGLPQAVEWTVLDAEGNPIPCELHLSALPSEQGTLLRVSLMDVRQRRATEEQRRGLEEQLRQSQKLEAVGQLTGGVAHDFNNLLTVIHGNLEMLAESTPLEEEDQSLLDEAIHAAERSARLTQRLLAFSRRQALAPNPLDLRSLVGELHDLLSRSLGEVVSVEFVIPDDTWPVNVDRAQLESAILNLCLNSRDAMPLGGSIRIHATNIPHGQLPPGARGTLDTGDYVRLAVSDTGLGMAQDVIDRAFDPFFTTKEVDKGTGLGLSMVYGFVTQSGGTVQIESTPGKGSTVSLILPRDASSGAEGPEGSAASMPSGKGETILVVEDDPGVTRLLSQFLDRLGYEAISAPDGRQATRALEGGQHVDALLTDLMLPGDMTGVAVAAAVRTLRPGLPVLFMSGYAEESLLEAARPGPGEDILRKPFDLVTLARKLRALFAD